MLKKFYQKELERKEAMNKMAKEHALVTEQKIEYDAKYPLFINQDTKILEISYHEDFYDDSEKLDALNKIRITFKDNSYDYAKHKREDESNPYVLDISTSLSLVEFEEKLQNCDSEEEIVELNE